LVDENSPLQGEAVARYMAEGERRAYKLGNRGPVRFTDSGDIHPEILNAYRQHGFYVLEGVMDESERRDLASDIEEHILNRLPVDSQSTVDRAGRPAIGINNAAPTLHWAKPLSDPFGGTNLAGGRHPVKMAEPAASPGSPQEIVYLILGAQQFSVACLRLYGHPSLLAVAAAINGDDFVPFNDALFIKEPGLGASVAWHRDGLTHWDHPDWDDGTHGFNFMGQVHGSTPANGVWVVPGTHKLNKVDIKTMVHDAGSDRLPDAIPLVCAPGDVAISNRQLVHGSFANTSSDWRITVNMGFHRRASVLNVEAGGLHNARAVYDDERIVTRSRLIGYAQDARRQRYPDETQYKYQPFDKVGRVYLWDDAARDSMKDYNLLDLSI
jgi:hypothetical protein